MGYAKNDFDVVYVVTSRGGDAYSAMACVSAAGGARLANPDVRIVVACDPVTAIVMEKAKDPLLYEIDQLAVHETLKGSAVFRSRHIKTRLRLLREGPFVALDSDTFVRGNLGVWFSGDWDVGAACNHGRTTFDEQLGNGDRDILKATDWKITQGPYFNSGVIFYQEREGARRFAEQWHQFWLESVVRSKRYQDQPAFNGAAKSSGARLCVLPNTVNAQIRTRFQFHREAPGRGLEADGTLVDRNAVVWHYYSSACKRPITEVEALVARLRSGAELEPRQVEKIAACSDPWIHRDRLDDLAIRWFETFVKLGEPARLWLEGTRLRSVLSLVKL